MAATPSAMTTERQENVEKRMIDDNGRIILPKKFRSAAGIGPGDEVDIRMVTDEEGAASIIVSVSVKRKDKMCLYGAKVECDPTHGECDRCGFNPDVEQRRVEQIQKEHTKHVKYKPRKGYLP